MHCDPVARAGSVIRSQRYSDAVNLLLRYAAASEASNAKSSQCRAYLGTVVVQLFAENATEAWQVYQVSLVSMSEPERMTPSLHMLIDALVHAG